MKSNFAVRGGLGHGFNVDLIDIDEDRSSGETPVGSTWMIGATSGTRLGNYTWIHTGFNFIRTGLEVSLFSKATVDNNFFSRRWRQLDLTQVEIPVLVHREFGLRQFRLFAEGGINFSYLASHNYRTMVFNEWGGQERLILLGPERLGVSASISLGVIVGLSQWVELFAQPVYRHMLSRVRTGGDQDLKFRPRTLTLEVGVRKLLRKPRAY